MAPDPAAWPDETIFRCRTCEAPLSAKSGGVCGECESLHCPYCGMTSHFWRDGGFFLHDDPCSHLIASYSRDAGEWDLRSPLAGVKLPHLEVSLATEPPDFLLSELFGDLKTLLSAYWETGWSGGGGGLTSPPDEMVLLERLMDCVTVPTRRVGWSPAAFGMGSSGGDDYFAAEAERFERETLDLLLRLEAAFELLKGHMSR